jgi:DNA-binding response OmpR family regulator
MIDDLKNSRILIIDDQESNTEILSDFLEIIGFTQIKSINDSRDAIQTIREYDPELLLLDLMMPNLSGFEVIELLKKENLFNAYLPILVLTADALEETKQKALQDGAKDFLTKPYSLVEVNLRINNLLLTVYLMKQLRNQNKILEEKVNERTLELSQTLENIKKQNASLREISWAQSHLVRAPLARIMGIIQVLKTDITDDDFDKDQWVQFATDSANELDAVIRDITQKSTEAKIDLTPPSE